jgi:hypothetical protein
MDAKKKLQQGWIHALVTFEVIGKPKEHVEKSLKDFLEAVKKNDGIEFLEQHVEDATKNEKDDFYSTFAEVDMLMQNIETMTWLAMNFTPASIEVIEPSSFKFTALDLQNWLNDLLSKLHTIGIGYKQQSSKAEYLKKNLVSLINNTIIMSLARKPKKLSELSKDTTLAENALKQHLEKLVKDKKVVEKKGVYSLA